MNYSHLENHFNKDKVKEHITNEAGNCIRWCYRCQAIGYLEQKFRHATGIDLFETILDLKIEITELKKES